MNDLFKKIHAWLITGTDRQLFRRSLLLLLVLAVFVQIGLNKGDWFSYLAAFGVGVAYTYLWIEMAKRFTGRDNNKNDKPKNEQQKNEQQKNEQQKDEQQK